MLCLQEEMRAWFSRLSEMVYRTIAFYLPADGLEGEIMVICCMEHLKNKSQESLNIDFSKIFRW